MKRMRRYRRVIFFIVALLVMWLTVAWGIIPAISPMPDNLGVIDGQLSPCPPTPNCVSTQQDTAAAPQFAPLRFDDLDSARTRLKDAVHATIEEVTLITEGDDYLHYEFRVPVIRFIDDVEFYFDTESGEIHFRSASRIGSSDFGVNATRMQQVSDAYQAQ